jgi:hypothetical protein
LEKADTPRDSGEAREIQIDNFKRDILKKN